jgi:hypothetical protein
MSRRRWVLGLVIFASLSIFMTGCESLRRKFTRVNKGSESKETMVITPRDYSAHPFTNDVLYRQYFTYWKSWNQELVRSLDERASHKKILDCVKQCLINLKKMKSYLNDDQAPKLDVFVQKTELMMQQIEAAPNLLPSQFNSFRYDAERILSSVNRQFDARKMKDAVKASESGA